MGVCEQFHALKNRAYPLGRKREGHSGDEQKIRLEVLTAFTVNSTTILEHDAVYSCAMSTVQP
jgi:hypothetical protein